MRMNGRAPTMKSTRSLTVAPNSDMTPRAAARAMASQVSRRNFVRQYQTRRRETMSSSTSSRPAPYSDARGISRCDRTSMNPRNAITNPNVASSAQPTGQSCWT
jgi:hypothetical protein